MSKSSERCLFCRWNRNTCWQGIRFYSIPKEPGLKKFKWLKVIGNLPITKRDRVCSIHFRSGRSPNDSSHEDFAPHLFLPNEPEVRRYLEQTAEKDLTSLLMNNG